MAQDPEVLQTLDGGGGRRSTVDEDQVKVLQAALAQRDSQISALRQRVAEVEKLTPSGALERIQQLEEQCLASSKQVVEQGEKNFQIQQKLSHTSGVLKSLQSDADGARGLLIAAIAGNAANPDNYKNVSLQELARVALRGSQFAADSKGETMSGTAATGGGGDAGGEDNYEDDTEGAAPRGGGGGGHRDDGQIKIHAVMEVERENHQLKTRNRKLQDQVQALERALTQSQEIVRTVGHAKAGVSDMHRRMRVERENRERAEEAIQHEQEKVEALSDHIEKLMVHLKHEAASKAKAFEAQRLAEQEIQALKERNAVLTKSNASRARTIRELKEGSKILEDQLRLMDEKYIELRGKLDWTRAHSQKEVRRIQTQANRLRAQVMLSKSATHLGASVDMTEDDSPPSPDGGQDSRKFAPGTSGGHRRAGTSSQKQLRPHTMGAPPRHAAASSPALQDVRDFADGAPADETDPSLPWSSQRLQRNFMM